MSREFSEPICAGDGEAQRYLGRGPNTSPVECHDLHRQMAEVLDLRAMVASLENGSSKKRRAENFERPSSVELKV